MEDTGKTALFEEMPVHKAVMTLSIPTVLSSLVMVIYNLADTYFVGMLNDPVQNAAVTLAAPVLLAFNAVNNLFGVGTSSMMSRALGSKDYGLVRRSSAFGFYCTLIAGVLFSLFFTILHNPLLHLLGADAETMEATAQYLKWTVSFGAVPAILNVVMAYMVRAEGASLHASIGTMSGCLLNILLDPFFVLPMGLNMGAAGAGLATMYPSYMPITLNLWNRYARKYFLETALTQAPTRLSSVTTISGKASLSRIKVFLPAKSKKNSKNARNCISSHQSSAMTAAYLKMICCPLRACSQALMLMSFSKRSRLRAGTICIPSRMSEKHPWRKPIILQEQGHPRLLILKNMNRNIPRSACSSWNRIRISIRRQRICVTMIAGSSNSSLTITKTMNALT